MSKNIETDCKIMEMKKRQYIKPSLVVVATATTAIIMASGVSASEKGIEYGGVDEEGVKDPSARRHDVWEEEADEQ